MNNLDINSLVVNTLLKNPHPPGYKIKISSRPFIDYNSNSVITPTYISIVVKFNNEIVRKYHYRMEYFSTNDLIEQLLR